MLPRHILHRGLVMYDASSGYVEYYSAEGGKLNYLANPQDPGRLWTHIVPGGWYGGLLAGLLFYEASTGSCRFVRPIRDLNGLSLKNDDLTGLPTNGTHVVSGTFGGPNGGERAGPDTGLLAYTEPAGKWLGFEGGNTHDFLVFDAATGNGGFYRAGEIYREADHTLGVRMGRMRPNVGWRSWTHVVPGQFGGDGITDLLLYEASTGTGEFYTVGKDARIELLRSHTGWRTSWSHIVPGYFGEGDGTDLLFYDADVGIGDFYAVSDGGLEQLSSNTGWRTNWHSIVPGDFEHPSLYHVASAYNGYTSLLFYDTAGLADFYATDMGRLEALNSYTDWGKYTLIASFDSELRITGES